MGRSHATTRGISVDVESVFVPDHSSPEDGRWLFAYTVTIANDGAETARLLTRHWIITDGDGHVEEVKGPGVVGEQPRLRPGENFRYTSACPLRTSFGTMQGTYQMVTDTGDHFDAEIAPFSLSLPYAVN
jgi:ApaG protein